MFKLLIISFLNLIFWECQNKPFSYQGDKIKGISCVAPPKPIDSSALQPILKTNANWVALMPYGFVKQEEAKLYYGNGHQWWGELPEGIATCVKLAHQKGLKVMIKPQVWMGHGAYTGNFELKTEKDWQTFEQQYRHYILDFAKVADSTHAEILCIGTEFNLFVKKRSDFWYSLISDTRKIFKGKLTYAENWDCFEQVSFWQTLDFVGIDAYFPLSEEQNPSVETLQKAWGFHLKKMQKLSSKIQKPVLFTEFGYQNIDFATQKPWESVEGIAENDALQAKAYEAFFKEVWGQSWVAGGFVWKWFPQNSFENFHDRYSPQGRPAEAILRAYYKNK